MINKSKTTLATLFLFCVSVTMYSQNMDLSGGLDDATDQLTDIFSSVKTFLFVLAAIVGVYGAFNVYSKYQSQDQDAAKSAAKFGFGFIFLMAAGFIIDAVFIN